LIKRIGLSGEKLYLCTAFYSRSALEWLSAEVTAHEVNVGVRIDFTDISDWSTGYINPEALLNFADQLIARGSIVNLIGSPDAHAKVFVGNLGSIIGSANLSIKGFGGGLEVVAFEGNESVRIASTAATQYLAGLEPFKVEKLRTFVTANKQRVALESAKRRAQKTYADENRLPRIRFQGKKASNGTYPDFVQWLDRQNSGAATEIAMRARGKGQLQGHIDRNFHGLRQYLITNPAELERYRREDENVHKLSADPAAEARLASFVTNNAVNEARFDLDIWKTYLPIECGGRAGKHGGTIGNLNRMLPLVARYLTRKTGRA